MKAITTIKSTLIVMSAAMVFACKKNDDGELDKEGESTNAPSEMRDSIPADTISGGREGINGSGIGSGNPNTSGTADQNQ